ncbi:MAG: pantoate--beta-alanine ligase [Rhodothermales bacterium]
MHLIHNVSEMQRHADAARAAGKRLVLVPTMGALHEGHFALVREGLRNGNEITVSIFVNPTQFGPGEDYSRYPRTLEDDLERLHEMESAITVFAPSVEEMYPGGTDTNLSWVEVERLDEHLCGRHRPGHFRGVATVVARLLNVCKPHVAIFGLKDAQQFVILNRMVKDLLFDVEVIGLPTVREADGLALSSRNAFLTPEERSRAVVIARAVEAGKRAIEGGARRAEDVTAKMRDILAGEPRARPQYVELVDAAMLQPISEITPGREVLAAAAVFFGQTRLIDSAFLRSPGDLRKE